MRDKRGQLVLNAHLHGMLSRVCRLLEKGVRPVFIFDGGAPAIKKQALNERRKARETGGQMLAEAQTKLLQAKLKRHLLGLSGAGAAAGASNASRAQRRATAEDDMYRLPESGARRYA